MKRVLFTCAAALCAAVGLSSFKATSKTFATHYFIVKTGSGANAKFVNADVVGTGSLVAPNPGANGCTATQFKCIVTFTDSQIIRTALGATILKTSAILSQANVTTYAKRQLQ